MSASSLSASAHNSPLCDLLSHPHTWDVVMSSCLQSSCLLSPPSRRPCTASGPRGSSTQRYSCGPPTAPLLDSGPAVARAYKQEARQRPHRVSCIRFYPKPKHESPNQKGMKSLMDIIAKLSPEHSVNAREHWAAERCGAMWSGERRDTNGTSVSGSRISTASARSNSPTWMITTW